MYHSVICKTQPLGEALLRCAQQQLLKRNCSAASSVLSNFETLAIKVPKPFVYHVELNRPEKLNAMNNKMWMEIGKCFDELSQHPECRAIVLSAAGKLFCAGIDLNDMSSMGAEIGEHDDVARRCKVLDKKIKAYQDSISSLEKCCKPVIGAIHSACVGGAVDLITAADIRYCSKDAWFQVKEVDIGMAADVGTLQRLPRAIGSSSLARELAFTARKMQASEAKDCGFVSRVFDDKESLVNGAIEIAADIASKSPVAVQGTKLNMVYSADHTIQEGLDHIRFRNMTMLQSEDFLEAVMAQATKGDPPKFSKL
ncbi:delta(3,5)-Delta(2,4)-dienoyl-CoA isomerase, mitochondrial [Hetaerina americana]|uniref:delta(3,5)-Delta(2,4)-dienoyl-CoA isomerase, mitochondrial n=1 Tax=Hetaerina americana TaxID=62018 RepID=UPI003A7F4345